MKCQIPQKLMGVPLKQGKVTAKLIVKIFREEKLVGEVNIQSLRRERIVSCSSFFRFRGKIGLYKFQGTFKKMTS